MLNLIYIIVGVLVLSTILFLVWNFAVALVFGISTITFLQSIVVVIVLEFIGAFLRK